MSTSVPKLTYFNLAGRVFALRVALFKAFGKDGWTDDRIEFTQWPELKPTMPLGSLPVLTLTDGRRVTQTDAMLRWAGRAAGLYPSSADEALLVDEITFSVIDVLSKTPSAAGEEGKVKRTEYAESGLLFMVCTMLESKVGDDWLSPSGMSVADLSVTTLVDMIVTDDFTHVPPSYMDGFPKLKALGERVHKSELVTSYLGAYAN